VLSYNPNTKSLGINTSTPDENYNLSVNGSVGIGGTLNVSGDLRLQGALYDSFNNVGTATSVLISTGIGISWQSISIAVLQSATGYGTVGYATTVTLDFLELNGQTNTIELDGDLELLASNLSNGREFRLRLIPGASDRILTVPIGWKFYGDELTTILANKECILNLLSFGSSDADVRIITFSQI
jgi:hypothetical protein